MLAFLGLLALVAGDTDGPWSMMGQTGYAGEVVVNRRTGSSLFYWQFNALNHNISTDRLPLILWLQGGPGCSGEEGMLGERISPFYVDDNMVPHLNNNTWAQFYHLITVDFPYNVGFSFAAENSDLMNSTVGATNYLYTFLQVLASKYPTWFARDFYVFGESYAGHWVPAISYKILNENQSLNVTGGIYIPLKGMGMGDPLCDALYQTQYYDTYAYNLGLIDSSQKYAISVNEQLLATNINKGQFVTANNILNTIEDQLVEFGGGLNLYNIRDYNGEDFGNFGGWLNLPSTQTMLHVNGLGITWQGCNNDIFNAFSADITGGFITMMMPTILSQIKVLVYNGQDDLIINTIGVEQWLPNVAWDPMPKFLKSRKAIWNVQGNIAGYVQSYSNLTFVALLKSGHFAPFDQPIAMRDMVNRFIQNQGWN